MHLIFNPIPHFLNCDVDLLVNVVSILIPSEGLMPGTFFVESLYKTSIENNITNWRVFNDDQHIINFLHLEGTFKDCIINEGKHDQITDFDVTDQAQ
jgi:hypothetical protein